MTMDATSKRYWKESNGLSLPARTIFGSFQFFVFTKYVASFSFFDRPWQTQCYVPPEMT